MRLWLLCLRQPHLELPTPTLATTKVPLLLGLVVVVVTKGLPHPPLTVRGQNGLLQTPIWNLPCTRPALAATEPSWLTY